MVYLFLPGRFLISKHALATLDGMPREEVRQAILYHLSGGDPSLSPYLPEDDPYSSLQCGLGGEISTFQNVAAGTINWIVLNVVTSASRETTVIRLECAKGRQLCPDDSEHVDLPMCYVPVGEQSFAQGNHAIKRWNELYRSRSLTRGVPASSSQ